MLLLIDNYDSFTYNLAQYFEMLGQDVRVIPNDKITLREIRSLNPKYIVLSPGPKSPKEAGICLDVVTHFHAKIPMLGICLGHQSIASAFGAQIIQAPIIMHGKISPITHQQASLFQGLPSPFNATRYHSLVVEPSSLPQVFSIDAWTDDGTIMALSHKRFPLWGLQFHPEAILSEHGMVLLKNFLQHDDMPIQLQNA